MSMLHLHLFSALLALLCIVVVLALPKGRGAHRVWGRLGALMLLVAALSSFWLPGFGRFTPVHLLSVTTLVNVPYAVWAARRGRIAAHRRALLINAGGLAAAGLAAVAVPGRYLHTLLPG
ncbi:DUF2306 domain-containing protein [Sabulicella glaciei]|uniref:DUF2306 domain-containing protein n=1 Tax=Sabulicella glaciei TaxID=2984948 RepID=A0ABT3NY27_9PROT|nr:DUF2306 domain-containing protein [Roseococcus sp. MDT2-1-1]MCW8086813.1 DUF2306 domain-containing protein [Roseococcus sp. MDT2-1-1]